MSSNISTIRQTGLSALVRELGATGTILFIRQFEDGYGNYAEERSEMLKDIALDDIVSSIRERKKSETID